MLYGFGEDVQYAAINFYEKVSGGIILEDYDRVPHNATANYINLFASVTDGQQEKKTWSRAALRKKNAYAGGEHWIKVTFSSKNAAELACARSPHVLRGYLVYAEPYMSRGPGRDEAIPATQAGAQIMEDALPKSFATNTGPRLDGSPGGSSTTATSATATGNGKANGSQTSSSNTIPNLFANPQQQPHTATPQQNQLQSQQQPGPATIRRRAMIPGAKQATVHPASMALAPKVAKQTWSSWLLGTGDVIGSTVPKKEVMAKDGSGSVVLMFDWDRAGWYWRVFFWLDCLLGTDLCGLRSD